MEGTTYLIRTKAAEQTAPADEEAMAGFSEIVFLGTKDVAKCLGCNVDTARQIMKRRDFPLIMVGKNMRVSKLAFEAWAMERRV